MTPRPGESRVAWLTGGIGQGKTRLLRRLQRAAVAAGRACVYVPIPTLDPACITTWCLDQLGLPGDGGPAALHDAARRGFSVLVDDAERLPAESRALLAALAGRADADVRVVFASTTRAPEVLPAGSRWTLDDEWIFERGQLALGLDPNPVGDDALPTPPLGPHPLPERAERTETAVDAGASRDAESARATFPEESGLVGASDLAGESGLAKRANAKESDEAAAVPIRDARPGAELRSPRWLPWLATGAAVLALGVFLTRLPVLEPVAKSPEPAVEALVPEVSAAPESRRIGRAQESPSASLRSDGPARATPLPVRLEQAPRLSAEPERSPSVAERGPLGRDGPVRQEPPREPADALEGPADAMAQAPLEAEPRLTRAPLVASRREAPLVVGATMEPPPVAAPPPVQATRPTRVIVNAIPPALVEIDGRFIGETPIAELELEPGQHLVVAEFEDGTKIERHVAVSGEVMLLVFP